jgi:UrcA family protein
MSKSHRFIVRMVASLMLPALFVAAPAFAAAAAAVEAPPSVTVRYDDLNLTSPKGVASLYRRIQYAATEACRPAEGPQSVERMRWGAWNKCFRHAISEAVQAVHNEKLSAYHWQHTRGGIYQEGDRPATVARE